MTYTFDHVHVLCEDLTQVGAFLCDVLGARELGRSATIRNLELELGQVRIFVRERRAGELLAGAGIRRAGLDHLGVGVADIEAALAELTASGCTLVQPRTQLRADLVTAFVTCPGGLLLELLQRG